MDLETANACAITMYLVTCQPSLDLLATAMVSVEVSGGKTSTNITTLAEKGERYNCSVQAKNCCQLLSNSSASIEIQIEGNDTIVY